jgi:hypothetical protein
MPRGVLPRGTARRGGVQYREGQMLHLGREGPGWRALKRSLAGVDVEVWSNQILVMVSIKTALHRTAQARRTETPKSQLFGWARMVGVQNRKRACTTFCIVMRCFAVRYLVYYQFTY